MPTSAPIYVSVSISTNPNDPVQIYAATTPRGLEDLLSLLNLRGGNEDWDGTLQVCNPVETTPGFWWANGTADEVIALDEIAKGPGYLWDMLVQYTIEARRDRD